MAVTASIVVNFGDSAAEDALLRAEIDSRETGLNGGVTSFSPGESAYILTYKENISSILAQVSAGSISLHSTGSRQVTQELSFAGTNQASLQYPAASIDSVTWIGNDLGTLTYVGGASVRSQTTGVGIAKVTYTTNFTAYRLNAPATLNGLTSFNILVLFTGT